MQLLFDFFPVIVFFITFKFAGIYVATGVLIAAVVLQTAIQWLRHRKVSAMALISGGLVLVFGGLTLWLQDEAFIKWKVTVVNWLLAAGFLLSHVFGQQPLIQRMMGGSISLDRPQWLTLSWMWIGFFVLLGAVNMFVFMRYSTDVWVSFKLYGLLGLTLLFIVLQTWWLARKLPEQPEGPANHVGQ